jgi:hypothetical protein
MEIEEETKKVDVEKRRSSEGGPYRKRSSKAERKQAYDLDTQEIRHKVFFDYLVDNIQDRDKDTATQKTKLN